MTTLKRKVNERQPGQRATARHEDHVVGLAEFEPVAHREVRRIDRLPLYQRRMLDVFRRLPPRRRSLDHATEYCVGLGVPRLADRRDVEAIRHAKETVQDSGDDLAAWYETWPYDIEAHDTGRKTLFARLSPDNWQPVCQLADELGLTNSSVVALAVMTVLIEVALPEEQHGFMVQELRRFMRELCERATRAQELAALVTPSSLRTRPWSELDED
jgi:hypothetical protein